MRRKERYIWNTALLGFGIFSIVDIVKQCIEFRDQELPFWENYNGFRTLKQGGKGFFLGGATGYLVYSIQKWEEQDLPFCPDNHLHQILNENSLNNDPRLLEKAKDIISDLKAFLVYEFTGSLIGKPVDFGSIPKRTAIGGSSDFDLLVPFRKGTDSLDNIYNNLYSCIEARYDSEYFEVRKQRHSIGLIYDDDTHSIHFDIVPAKERNIYKETGELTIYRRATRFWETPSHIKTNVWKKRKAVVNRPEVRRVIRLMKVYREETGLKLNSTALQNLVIEAFDRNKKYVSSSLHNNFVLAMGHIANQIKNRQKVSDVANGNLNLLDNLSSSDRSEIANQIIGDLEKIDRNPNYLKEIFEL